MKTFETNNNRFELSKDNLKNILWETKTDNLKKLLECIEKIAVNDDVIMIYGEIGTGKTLYAAYTHSCSQRSNNVFKHFYCTDLSHDSTMMKSELFGHVRYAFTGAERARDGLFKSAHRGTLFLDEIGDLPYDIQGRLLKFLDENKIQPLGTDNDEEVDVRLIFATNKNLADLVKKNKFREDLYSRIDRHTLNIPPLRDRSEDIMPIAEKFLSELNEKWDKEKKLSGTSIKNLRSYSWPNNIRQLKNIIHSFFWKSGDGEILIQESDLEKSAPYAQRKTPEQSADASRSIMIPIPSTGFKMETFINKIKLTLYTEALSIADGNREKAGRLLGTSGTAVGSFLKKHSSK